MAETNPVKFLLNQSDEAKENAVVDSNAFSITKVLATGAVVVGPIAAGVVEGLKGLESQHWVALAIGLLGFLALIASADVIGRSMATAAKAQVEASMASIGGMTRFAGPVAGHRVAKGADPAIEVLAFASGGYFLVKEDSSIQWLKESDVRIP